MNGEVFLQEHPVRNLRRHGQAIRTVSRGILSLVQSSCYKVDTREQGNRSAKVLEWCLTRSSRLLPWPDRLQSGSPDSASVTARTGPLCHFSPTSMVQTGMKFLQPD